MNASHFRVFRDIAKTSSVSRGAELNGVSQSRQASCCASWNGIWVFRYLTGVRGRCD